jgi:hypothetical protein
MPSAYNGDVVVLQKNRYPNAVYANGGFNGSPVRGMPIRGAYDVR